MLRHLRSLRLMKNDNGWISTLLQEAENERVSSFLRISRRLFAGILTPSLYSPLFKNAQMHLMVFMEIRKPSKFFRALVLLTQG